jgi:hypothetical protein
MTNNNEPHDTLTALLTAHPDVAEWVRRCMNECEEAYTTLLEDLPADQIAECFLEDMPTDYFSAALARVADWSSDTGRITILKWGYNPNSGHSASIIQENYPEDFYYGSGEQASLREALIALWLALLALAVEPCGRCGGDGDIEVHEYEPDHEFHSFDACPDCNGSGRKHPGILDALVGSASSPRVGEGASPELTEGEE